MKKVLLALCAAITLVLLTGCEPSIRESFVSKLPDKLIYVADYDTELDLTGGEVTLIMVSFIRPDFLMIHSMDGEFISYRLHHRIDFDTPGVYVVTGNLGLPEKQATFEIQVVTQEEYDAMQAEQGD
jgi:hypothetical protein